MSSNAAMVPGMVSGSARARELREEIARLEKTLGRRPKLLACELGSAGREADAQGGQGGQGGHAASVEQLALKARDAGFDVVYEGAGATPAQVITSAIEEGVHLIGLAVGAGVERDLVHEVSARAQAAGIGAVPIVVAHGQSELSAVIADLVQRVATPSAR